MACRLLSFLKIKETWRGEIMMRRTEDQRAADVAVLSSCASDVGMPHMRQFHEDCRDFRQQDRLPPGWWILPAMIGGMAIWTLVIWALAQWLW